MHLTKDEERNCVNTDTVVFFYVVKKAIGRKYPWQKVEFKTERIKWGERRLVAAGIPEYDYNRKNWRGEVIRKKIITEFIPILKLDRVENTNFLVHKDLISNEWGRMFEEIFPLELIELPDKNNMAKVTPEDIVETLMADCVGFDGLIIADKTEELEEKVCIDLPELTVRHCNKVNYLAVVTDNPEKYVEVFDEINEEYGLNGMTFESMEQVKPSAKYKILVVDGGTEYKQIWRYLPAECTYLDLLSSTERQRLLEARRKDIRYISFYKQVTKKIHQKI